MTTYTTELQNVLNYMGNTFVDTPNKTSYTGNNIDTTRNNLTFVETIIKGYSIFKTNYTSSLPNTVDNTTIQDILVRKLSDISNSNYKKIQTSGSGWDTINEFNASNMEINYTLILPTPSTNALLQELDKVQNAYSFLSDASLKKYKTNKNDSSIPITNYTVTAIANSSPTEYQSNIFLSSTTKTNINTVLGNIDQLDLRKNDIFIIRRMLLLYIILTNIYISMYLYEKYAGTPSPNTNVVDDYIKNISNAANVLITLNKNFSTTDTTTPTQRSNIMSNLNKNIQTYKTNNDIINKLDNEVRDKKMELSSNENMFKNTKSMTSSVSTYTKVLISIFVISLVAILVVSLSPFEKTTRLMIGGSILVIVLILGVIITTVFHSKIEGFEQGEEEEEEKEEKEEEEEEEEKDKNIEGYVTYNLPSFSDLGGTAINTTANIIKVYNDSFLSEAVDYLNLTIYLALILQTSKTYGNMNNAVQREITYFNQMNDMIDTTNNKLIGAASSTEMNAITSSARTSFLLQLGVIILITIIAYVIVGDNIKYQPIIMIVAGIVILLVMFNYAIQITKRVRTDPRKFYWDPPSNVSVLTS